MPTTTCPRCGYTTGLSSNMRKHLQKKKPCLPVLEDIPYDELLQHIPQLRQTSREKAYKCRNCSKCFTTPQGKSRHERHFCKGDSSEPPSDIRRIVEETVQDVLTRQQNVTINNITTNNTVQNTVNVINAFGNEDTSHLTDKFLNTCLRRTSKGFVQLLEKLHWDPVVPANANIRISNRKIPLAEIQESGKWRFVPRDKAINQMIDKGQDILSEHFEDHQEEIKANVSNSLWDHISQWMDKMQDKDKTTIQDLLLEIYCLILNNS